MNLTPAERLRLMQELDDDNPIEDGNWRPPLNYIGTKRESLKHIHPLLKRNDTWIDVFGGSGIVTMTRPRSTLEVFNDKNSGVAAFFLAIQQDCSALIERIALMPHSREMFDYFRNNPATDTIERGAQWYYLVQTSFAGKGQFWGRVTQGKSNIHRKLTENLQYFQDVKERFFGVQIENRSWENLFEEYDDWNVTWYLDPPYFNTNDYTCNMTEEDHIRLCARIMALKGFVALSGFDNHIYNSFDWDGHHSFEVRNMVAGVETLTTRDTKRTECLWIKE